MELIRQEVFGRIHSKRHTKTNFTVSYDETDLLIKGKIDAKCDATLGEIGEINQAIALKSDRSSHLFDRKLGANYKPVIDGRDIQRYELNWSGKYLKYDVEAIHSCKREGIFLSKEKIFFRRVSSFLVATLDTDRHYALNTLVVINKYPEILYDIKFILGVFNSRIYNYYYFKFLKSTKKVFSEIQARQIRELPFPKVELNTVEGKRIHDEIAGLVVKILEMKKKSPSVRASPQAQSHIAHIDERIDRSLYTFFNLTPQEIRHVEEALTQ